MSGNSTWLRIAGGTGWALLVLAAFRSEPFVQPLIGDQYTVSHHWCGAWGCSASVPRLLAWQMPMILTIVPAAWLAAHYIPWVARHAGHIAVVVLTGVLVWIAICTVQSWSANQLQTVTDILRRIMFVSVAGTSIVIPVALAGLVFLASSQLRRSRSNTDTGPGTQQSEDFGDVVVTHVDASS
jgi:hypothetical protein